jgi:hypothetical protein
VSPHHDQRASDDANPAQHGKELSFYHAFAKPHLLISVTFSTPKGFSQQIDSLRAALLLEWPELKHSIAGRD